MKKSHSEKPDIIFLPGDIVETYGNTNEAKLNEFIEILKDIKSVHGIYAVRGNHDLPGPNVADKINFNKRLGITLLSDSLKELDNKVYIIGLKNRGNNEKRPIDSLLKFRTKDLPVILLDHEPFCLGKPSETILIFSYQGIHITGKSGHLIILLMRYTILHGVIKKPIIHIFLYPAEFKMQYCPDIRI